MALRLRDGLSQLVSVDPAGVLVQPEMKIVFIYMEQAMRIPAYEQILKREATIKIRLF